MRPTATLALLLALLAGIAPARAGDPPTPAPAPPAAPTQPEESGQLGIELEPAGGADVHVAFIDIAGPSYVAGLRVGSKVLEIDGRPVTADDLRATVERLRTVRAGQTVTLKWSAGSKEPSTTEVVAVTSVEIARRNAEWVAKRLGDPSQAGVPKAFLETFDSASEPPQALVPAAGQWLIGGDKSNRVLGQLRPVDPWAVALFAGPNRSFADGKVSVRFQLIAGREDQTAGVIVRAKDAKNYYLARANGLENNFRLYSMKEGNRWQLASISVTPPKPIAWHTLEVTFQGPNLRATLDGKDVVEAKDEMFTSGWTGLWTKADSVTQFDDFAATPAETKPAPGK